MRIVLIVFGLLLATTPTFGETIDQVLQRSQLKRLESMVPSPAGDARAAVIRASFSRLRAAEPAAAQVALVVVQGGVVAECLFGRVIVADVSLAEMPEGERLFVLAHELGHIAHGHWAHFSSVFRQHIPGEVVQAHTDAVAPLLGAEMSALSHRHEYDADAYGMRALRQFGFGFETVLASFMRHGVTHDTATYPGTRKRVAHLRAVEKN